MSTDAEGQPLSGWCATFGRHTAQQHEECQRRLDAGLLGECGCPMRHDERKT